MTVNFSKQNARKSKGITAQNKQHQHLSKRQSSRLVLEDSKRRLSKAVAKVLADYFLSNLENEVLRCFSQAN